MAQMADKMIQIIQMQMTLKTLNVLVTLKTLIVAGAPDAQTGAVQGSQPTPLAKAEAGTWLPSPNEEE